MTDTARGTALITGASSGIGAVYADRLARRGYDLILVARDRAKLDGVALGVEQIGRSVRVHPADLADRDGLASVEALVEREPDLTLVINNAGISIENGYAEAAAAQVEQLAAVNVTAVLMVARAAARAFGAKGRGAIVNMSSVLALAPEQFDPGYSATKAFVLALSQGMAAQLEPRGVRVQAVLPGATRTEIWAKSGKDVNAFPPDIVMEVGDLVDAALDGFDKGETVTIPPLADDTPFRQMQELRTAMGPVLSRRNVAPRYLA